DAGTDAGRAFEEQIIAAAKAAQAHGVAVEQAAIAAGNEAGATRLGAKATQDDIVALRAWATQHGVNAKTLDALIGSMEHFADSAGTDGNRAGRALGDGLAAGIHSKIPAVAQAAQLLALNA